MKKVHNEILVITESEFNDPEVRRQVWMCQNVFVSDENGEHLQPLSLRNGPYQKPNVQAHAHAAQSENEKLRAGGVSRAAPCSGLEDHPKSDPSDKCNIFLFDRDTYKVKDSISIEPTWLYRIDYINVLVDKMIQRNGGIGANETIRITRQSPQELHLPCGWDNRHLYHLFLPSNYPQQQPPLNANV